MRVPIIPVNQLDLVFNSNREPSRWKAVKTLPCAAALVVELKRHPHVNRMSSTFKQSLIIYRLCGSPEVLGFAWMALAKF
jgi:hypothetical protein